MHKMQSTAGSNGTQTVTSILPIIPVIILFFSQMLNCLCTVPVYFMPLVVRPSIDQTSPVDHGLRDSVRYVVKTTIANRVVLNRYDSEHTADSWLSIGT